MVNSQTDATLVRVVGLEKAISEIKSQFQKRTDRLEALNSQIEDFMLEFRASRESPLMTFPKFDGSDALGWLARADQYFLMTKIPPSSRVDVAMLAIDGPAKPWKQLLVHRCPSLSWDRFVHELLKRFGDTIPPESRVTCNSSKHNSEDPIAAVHVAKNQPKIPPTPNDNTVAILPTVTAPLLSSSPSTTAQQEIPAINTSTNHPDLDTTADNSAALPLPVQHPILPPVCMTLPSPTRLSTPATVTAPLLSSSSDIPQFQPPFLPLLRRLVPAAAADHAKLMGSSTPPKTAMVTAPLLSASPDILQIQSPFSSLLRCLVSAAHQSTPMVVSFPGSLFSSAGGPFSYLVMLRFLHIVGHLLWFDALATTPKHEFEPPPGKVMGFDFNLSLEGKTVLRVRQLIQSGIWDLDANEIIGFGYDIAESSYLSLFLIS